MIERTLFDEEFRRVGINSPLTPVGFLNLMEFLTTDKLSMDEDSENRGWSHQTTIRPIPGFLNTQMLKEETIYRLEDGVIVNYSFDGKEQEFRNRLYSGKSSLRISGNSNREIDKVQRIIIGSIARRDYIPR